MKRDNSVLQRPRASMLFLVVSTLLWGIAFVYLYRSEYGAKIENASQRIDFNARDYFKNSTELDKRIKIYGFDDKTVSWINAGGLTIEQWAKFILALDKQKPSAIIIDKIFSVDATGIGSGRAFRKLARALAKVKTPVVVGSYTYPIPIKGRSTYPLDSRTYSVRGLSDTKKSAQGISKNTGQYVYGPATQYRKLFDRVGHIQYDGTGKIYPLLKTDETTYLPHLAFSVTSSKFTYNNGQLWFGKQRLPVNHDSSLNIDWISKKTFFGNTIAARNDLDRAFKNRAINTVKEGDVVIVLPNMFTGNTDFKETPYGMMPGGAHVVSLANSVLQQKWIKTFGYVEILIVLVTLFGAFIGAGLTPVFFSFVFLSITATLSGLGIYLFAFHNISMSWLFVAFAFIGSAISSFIGRSRDAERKSLIIKAALDGVVNTNKVDRMSKRPDALNFEARERVVTVMFIDVVGFSLIAENQIPRRAFDELKSSLQAISALVYQHGGVVNKNLGDGLLCFFGYDIEQDQIISDHAEKAMISAIRIQEQNLVQSLRSGADGGMVFPLRIGLHTTSVFMGDLGTGSRIDFTVIGNGVNFAKRLEGACQPNSILISHTTHELITNLMLDREHFSEKQIKIKHHSDLVSAFEYDPFFKQQNLRDQAEKAFRSCVNSARAEQRWSLSDAGLVNLQTNYGVGELINFSASGMSVKLKRGMARGEQIVITIGSKNGALEHSLVKENLRQILCEVAWSYSEKTGYVHGIRYTGLALEKSEILVNLIREHGSLLGGSIIGTGPISRINEAI